MSIDLGMTVKEAAVELGYSEGAVYELCASGRLPHRRVGPRGKQIRITHAHVDRYLASCERDETNAPGAPDKPPAPCRRRPARTKRAPGLRFDGKPYEVLK